MTVKGDSVFFRFRINEKTRQAVDAMAATEFLNPTVFARQAFHNELVRRGYLDAALIGMRSPADAGPVEPIDKPAPKAREPF